jgi:hypothetical protein
MLLPLLLLLLKQLLLVVVQRSPLQLLLPAAEPQKTSRLTMQQRVTQPVLVISKQMRGGRAQLWCQTRLMATSPPLPLLLLLLLQQQRAAHLNHHQQQQGPGLSGLLYLCLGRLMG